MNGVAIPPSSEAPSKKTGIGAANKQSSRDALTTGQFLPDRKRGLPDTNTKDT